MAVTYAVYQDLIDTYDSVRSLTHSDGLAERPHALRIRKDRLSVDWALFPACAYPPHRLDVACSQGLTHPQAGASVGWARPSHTLVGTASPIGSEGVENFARGAFARANGAIDIAALQA
ncbi:hypothetical protein B1964_23195 [Gordonia sp. i37]|nr:hypothetical protein B1964_23195 [Gordonia sp. i37]